MFGDEQGSAQVMMQVTLDASGAMAPASVTDPIARNAYTPYGAVRGADNLSISHGWLNRIADSDTGLTYLGARYYDPLTSRFISPDPLMNPMDPRTLDAYMYANNNPISYSDTSGLYASKADEQMCGQYGCTSFNRAGTPINAGKTGYSTPASKAAARAVAKAGGGMGSAGGPGGTAASPSPPLSTELAVFTGGIGQTGLPPWAAPATDIVSGGFGGTVWANQYLNGTTIATSGYRFRPIPANPSNPITQAQRSYRNSLATSGKGLEESIGGIAKVGRGFRAVPIVGAVIGAGFTATESYYGTYAGLEGAERGWMTLGRTAAITAGGELGGQGGAAVGALGGPVGIVIGAAGGGFLGGLGVEKLFDSFWGQEWADQKAVDRFWREDVIYDESGSPLQCVA